MAFSATISFSFRNVGQLLSKDACGAWLGPQFAHRGFSASHCSLRCWGDAHLPQTGLARQYVFVCPNRWHAKHRMGFGTYGRTLTRTYPTVTYAGSSVESNVRMMLSVGIICPSLLLLILYASVTPWSASPSTISSSLVSRRSKQFMTPLEEFFVLWAVTEIFTVSSRFTPPVLTV